MKRPTAFASLLLVLGGSPLTRGQSAVPPPPGFPAVGEPTTIAVTSTGAAPRRALRYVVPAGYRGHMNMDMTMSLAMRSGGGQVIPAMQVPTVRVGADTAVTGVSATGDITFTIAFTGMALQSTAGVDPTALGPFRAVSDELKNVKGTATISSRGVTRSLQMDTSQASSPQIGQMMDSVKTSVAGISMPLPEEPVGVGAHWEVRQAMGSTGMALFQKVECELAALDAGSATLTLKIEQTAPAQPMRNPSLPPGADLSIESITGAGTGTMTVAFNALVPTSDMSSRSTMVMTMKAGGAAAQQVTVETTMKVAVAPGRE